MRVRVRVRVKVRARVSNSESDSLVKHIFSNLTAFLCKKILYKILDEYIYNLNNGLSVMVTVIMCVSLVSEPGCGYWSVPERATYCERLDNN